MSVDSFDCAPDYVLCEHCSDPSKEHEKPGQIVMGLPNPMNHMLVVKIGTAIEAYKPGDVIYTFAKFLYAIHIEGKEYALCHISYIFGRTPVGSHKVKSMSREEVQKPYLDMLNQEQMRSSLAGGADVNPLAALGVIGAKNRKVKVN